MLAVITTLGLDRASRTMAEAAVLMWLEPLHIRQGGYLQTLDFYNGELDSERGQEALFQRMFGGSPAVLVSSGAKVGVSKSSRNVERKEEIDIEVLFASTHLRDRVAQMHGDEASVTDTGFDPGLHAIMDDVDLILMGRRSGACGQGRYQPMLDSPIVQLPELTLWRRRYQITYNNSGVTDAELNEGDVFSSILARHNLVDDNDPVPSTVNPVAEALTDE